MSSPPVSFYPATGKAAATVPGTNGWPVEEVAALFELPLSDLLYRAQQIHRAHFDPTEVELATLLSIKTGGCPEDCGYCPQAARYHTDVVSEEILPLDAVVAAATAARAAG